MIRTFQLGGLVLAAAGLMLAGCASNVEKQPLEGKRINVIVSQSSLKADPAASKLPVRIPVDINLEEWPQIGAFPSHFPAHVSLPAKVQQAWSRSIGPGSNKDRTLMNPPIAANGVLFTINTDAEIYAIDAEKGKKLWDYELELADEEMRDFSGGLAITGSTLVAATGSGEVFGINAENGEMQWHRALGAPVRAAPTVAEGLVFVVAHNNRMFALNPADGTIAWTHSGIEEGLALMGGAAPAVAQGVVVVPYSSGELYALEAKTGRYLWHDALAFNVGVDLYSSLVDVVAAPVIAEGVVFGVNHNGQLAALELASGRRLWQVDVSATSMPWVAGNMIYVVSDDATLIAVHRTTGKVKYVQNLMAMQQNVEEVSASATYFTGPVLAGGRLIVVNNQGYAFSLNPENGQLLAAAELPGGGSSLSPVVVNNSLYFLSDNGTLICFR